MDEVCRTKETSIKGYNKENHFASIAFYVRDAKTGKVYGFTNRHVTLQTDKIAIKLLPQSKFIHFGTSVKNLDEKCLDIGLIEIDPFLKDQLSNKENIYQRVCIYSGPFESIFEKEIFKYRPNENLYEVCRCETPKNGIILSEGEHEETKPENGQFLVKSENGVFAVKGESGTAVAVQGNNDNIIELLGIICGGSGDNIVCLFLPSIFLFYKNQYDMVLELYKEFHGSRYDDKTISSTTVAVSKTDDKVNDTKCIHFGVKIYFTPEQISPFSFHLVKYALDLTCVDYKTVNVENNECLIKRENELSLLVSDRKGLVAIFENDRPDYVAIENGMLACDRLYMGEAIEAEKCLKKAIVCVTKSDELGLRLLCKLTTYITWHCLVENDDPALDDLKALLENAIDSFECDYRSMTGFPLETLGYIYYDYSRYYMLLWDKTLMQGHRTNTTERSYRFEAVEKAKQSVTIFQEDHEVKKSAATLRRLILAKCQQAYALLGCGHEFSTNECVSEAEIREAEYIIRSMESAVSEMPFAQTVNYLIALCDLQYRKGHTSEALK